MLILSINFIGFTVLLHKCIMHCICKAQKTTFGILGGGKSVYVMQAQKAARECCNGNRTSSAESCVAKSYRNSALQDFFHSWCIYTIVLFISAYKAIYSETVSAIQYTERPMSYIFLTFACRRISAICILTCT